MKIVLDIKGNPTEGDILVYQNGRFEFVHKDSFLHNLSQKNKECRDSIDSARIREDELASRVLSIEQELRDIRGE